MSISKQPTTLSEGQDTHAPPRNGSMSQMGLPLKSMARISANMVTRMVTRLSPVASKDPMISMSSMAISPTSDGKELVWGPKWKAGLPEKSAPLKFRGSAQWYCMMVPLLSS